MNMCKGCHEHIPATDGCLREACGLPCNRLTRVVATLQGRAAPEGAAGFAAGLPAGQHFFPPPRLRPTSITSSLSEPRTAQQGDLAGAPRDEAREDSTPAADPSSEFSSCAWEVPCVYSASEGGCAEVAQPEVVGEVRDGAEGRIAKAWAKCQRAARKALHVLREAAVRPLL